MSDISLEKKLGIHQTPYLTQKKENCAVLETVFFLLFTFMVIGTLAILSWPAHLGAVAVYRWMLPAPL